MELVDIMPRIFVKNPTAPVVCECGKPLLQLMQCSIYFNFKGKGEVVHFHVAITWNTTQTRVTLCMGEFLKSGRRLLIVRGTIYDSWTIIIMCFGKCEDQPGKLDTVVSRD